MPRTGIKNGSLVNHIFNSKFPATHEGILFKSKSARKQGTQETNPTPIPNKLRTTVGTMELIKNNDEEASRRRVTTRKDAPVVSREITCKHFLVITEVFAYRLSKKFCSFPKDSQRTNFGRDEKGRHFHRIGLWWLVYEIRFTKDVEHLKWRFKHFLCCKIQHEIDRDQLDNCVIMFY